MPPIETSDLHQDAALWAHSQQFDNRGNPKVADPVDIKCRWEWGRQEAVDPHGNTIAIEATVVVAQEVNIGSAMVEGTVAGLTGDETKMYVQTSAKIPDIKNRNQRRVLGLNRLSDTVPASE